MNKLKVALSRLRDYLGRDTEAIRLLDEVAKIANDIRTSSAATSEELANVSKSHNAARQSIRDLEIEISGLKEQSRRQSELHSRETRKREDLERQLSEYQRKPEEDDFTIETVRSEPSLTPTNTDKFPLIKKIQPFCRLLKTVRQIHPIAPPHYVGTGCFNIHDLMSDYSDRSLCYVGAIMTCFAMCNFPAKVVAEPNFSTANGGATILSEDTIRHFLLWMVKTHLKRTPSTIVDSDPRVLKPVDVF